MVELRITIELQNSPITKWKELNTEIKVMSEKGNDYEMAFGQNAHKTIGEWLKKETNDWNK